jgi:hypothetical protein
MKLKEFVEAVRKMRTAQENYLSDRKVPKLIIARDYERAVDEALRAGIEPDDLVIPSFVKHVVTYTTDEFQGQSELTEEPPDYEVDGEQPT